MDNDYIMPRMHHCDNILQYLIVVAVTLMLAACVVKPVPHQSIKGSALREIAQSYRTTVRLAYESKNKTWLSGWAGNVAVNFQDKKIYGLCYHWKKIVYAGVIDTVERVGWRATGIVVNEATKHEHHSVLIYDPALFRHKDLPNPAKQRLVYVLDPWREGTADIYTLDKWLERAGQITVEPRLVAVVTDLKP